MKYWTDRKIFDDLELGDTQPWLGHLIDALIVRNYDFQVVRTGLIHFDIDIRYTDITVKNSAGKSTYIKEIFVKLIISNDYTVGFYGTRFIYPYDHAVSQYTHSHLPTNATGHFKSFCLGNSYLEHFTYKDMVDRTEDTAYLLLITLDTYIRWESLEGGPYITLDNIRMGGLRYLAKEHVDRQEYINIDPEEPIKFLIVSGKVVIDSAWIESKLIPNCIEFDNNYYTLESSLPSDEAIEYNINTKLKHWNESNSEVYFFKGEEQKLVIKKPQQRLDQKKIVHPFTISLWRTSLSNQIERWLLEENRVESTIQDDSPSRRVGSDNVPML